MKRQGNLYHDICNIQNIIKIYQAEIKKNTKNKQKIERFENYLTLHLFQVYQMLIDEHVVFDRYFIFLIKEPKYRIIMSQSIKDKLVNHLVARYLVMKPFEKSLIDGNVATREGKGTHYGIHLLKKYIHELKRKNKNIYYLKCDISKYFYNIDHSILKKIMKTKIKDSKALCIIDQIIDSTNFTYISDNIKKICDVEVQHIQHLSISEKEKQKKIEELHRLPKFEQPGKGIPIGNMTSQAFAIIYLNELDHFIKEQLHVKYYVRYMDDFVCLDTDKQNLKKIQKKVGQLLQDKFALSLNPKTHIGMLKNGLDFLGYRFILVDQHLYLRLRTQIKKRYKRKMKKLHHLYFQNKVSREQLVAVKGSYYGHLCVGDTYYLRRKIVLLYESENKD